MNRKDLILAALSPKPDPVYSPAQIQKLLFVIDQEIGEELGGPFFKFIAYHYGPFDQSIYSDLLELRNDGFIKQIDPFINSVRKYKLTTMGKEKGTELLNCLDRKHIQYIKDLNAFITGLSFIQLISTIYKYYPAMKVNSVFQT